MGRVGDLKLPKVILRPANCILNPRIAFLWRQFLFWKDLKFEREVRNVTGSLLPLLRDNLAEKIRANEK